jgi:hypothetical protein
MLAKRRLQFLEKFSFRRNCLIYCLKKKCTFGDNYKLIFYTINSVNLIQKTGSKSAAFRKAVMNIRGRNLLNRSPEEIVKITV